MWEYNYSPNSDELYHYGVLGMKWGQHIRRRLDRSNSKLEKKASIYDKRKNTFYRLSEKTHSSMDLGRSNIPAAKASMYAKKAVKYDRKYGLSKDDRKKDYYRTKSAEMKYKSKKNLIRADTLSRTAPYGYKAMRYAIKSDEFAAKAERARYQIAKNTRYINALNRKYSSITEEELSKARKHLNSI